ncbi:MAG: hypothetical protein DMF49_09080 [Acidobacteria bacterium]|nr:MAG: hypothetical protein DMF49_09080 [Acidobacteriota bacterium]
MNRSSRSLAAALAAALLLASSGCGRQEAKPAVAEPSAVSVTVVLPKRQTLTRTLRVPGTLQAIEEAILQAKTSGYLSRITVDRGDDVRRGELLAEISVPEMKKEYEAMEARLKEVEADLKLREITAQRLASVRAAEPGAVTQQQVDEAQGQLGVAEATVNRTKAELARLQALMEYARIRAPFDGVVTNRFVDPGALIQLPTGSAQAPIVTLANMDRVRVFVDVPEPDVPFITRETPTRLVVDALPSETFTAKVTRFSSALDPKTRTMKTEIDFPNLNHSLRPGMFGAVTLELEKREAALTLPASALLVEKEGSYVFTVVNGAARRTAVKTGFTDGILVEIVGGLAGGESVILGGKGTVTDGMPVQVGGRA